MTRLIVAATVLTTLGCAGGVATPPAPKPLDPVGTYTFVSAFQGQPIDGVIVIEARQQGFGGMITPHVGPPPVPITSVTVAARSITIQGDAGGELLVLILEVAEDGTYTGTWSLGMDGGTMTGKKG